VLAPAGSRERFASLVPVADVIYVGPPGAEALDLAQALKELRARGIFSVLCEGGPKLAASLLAARAVDRFYWAIAPRLLGNDSAVPVLAGIDFARLGLRMRFDRVESAGDDVILSGTCSAD
jgi:diaminohydroxyphosphoribosylaminopyrimidine deaminase / 5-amino-6-(5-phosphoribosylamino)uracil reductase